MASSSLYFNIPSRGCSWLLEIWTVAGTLSLCLIPPQPGPLSSRQFQGLFFITHVQHYEVPEKSTRECWWWHLDRPSGLPPEGWGPGLTLHAEIPVVNLQVLSMCSQRQWGWSHFLHHRLASPLNSFFNCTPMLVVAFCKVILSEVWQHSLKARWFICNCYELFRDTGSKSYELRLSPNPLETFALPWYYERCGWLVRVTWRPTTLLQAFLMACVRWT